MVTGQNKILELANSLRNLKLAPQDLKCSTRVNIKTEIFNGFTNTARLKYHPYLLTKNISLSAMFIKLLSYACSTVKMKLLPLPN
jgi:hypothetical protein